MKKLSRDLLTGLSLLLPLVLSVQLLVWLLMTVEAWLKPVWELVLPQQWYLPGLALLSFLAIATVLGISFRVKMIRPLWRLGNKLLNRIPVLNYVYNTIRDFFDLLEGKKFGDEAVVWVTLPDTPYRLIGVVTKYGDDDDSRMAEMMDDNEVAVYLPMSYQMGGYMVVLPKESVERVDMEPADALRLIMSAGLGQRRKQAAVPQKPES